MMLYISMKFHENILNGFQVIEQSRLRDEQTVGKNNMSPSLSGGDIITTKLYRQELRFLCSARRLMMLYISLKFHENIMKGFQVIERTRNEHCQISKGNNYKSE